MVWFQRHNKALAPPQVVVNAVGYPSLPMSGLDSPTVQKAVSSACKPGLQVIEQAMPTLISNIRASSLTYKQMSDTDFNQLLQSGQLNDQIQKEIALQSTTGTPLATAINSVQGVCQGMASLKVNEGDCTQLSSLYKQWALNKEWDSKGMSSTEEQGVSSDYQQRVQNMVEPGSGSKEAAFSFRNEKDMEDFAKYAAKNGAKFTMSAPPGMSKLGETGPDGSYHRTRVESKDTSADHQDLKEFAETALRGTILDESDGMPSKGGDNDGSTILTIQVDGHPDSITMSFEDDQQAKQFLENLSKVHPQMKWEAKNPDGESLFAKSGKEGGVQMLQGEGEVPDVDEEVSPASPSR